VSKSGSPAPHRDDLELPVLLDEYDPPGGSDRERIDDRPRTLDADADDPEAVRGRPGEADPQRQRAASLVAHVILSVEPSGEQIAGALVAPGIDCLGRTPAQSVGPASPDEGFRAEPARASPRPVGEAASPASAEEASLCRSLIMPPSVASAAERSLRAG
jgi:hypothetical protein